MARVFVVGVGMTKFLKPREDNPDYPIMAKQAVSRALRDSGLSYKHIEQAAVGYVNGLSTAGQRALYESSLSGVPIMNVNNNCSTGSTALWIGAQMIRGGTADCVLALGFDKMEPGALGTTMFNDRANPVGPLLSNMINLKGLDAKAPPTPQIFGNAGIEHMEKYGTKDEHFAKIAEKNHRHSAANPYAQFRKIYTLEEVNKSPKIYGPLTKLQCCPTSDGAGAAILVSENFMKKHGLEDQAVEILDSVMTTDTEETFTARSLISLAGAGMSKRAADRVYSKTGVKPSDIDVCELHDCFSANELITYEALGFADTGKAGKFIDNDWKMDNGKKVVINPSGGLISKGHPLGATGLAQATELCWQLRGMAADRQVKGAKYALQHNLGLGGACVVTLYKKYNDKQAALRPDQTSDPDVLEKIEKSEVQKASILFPKL